MVRNGTPLAPQRRVARRPLNEIEVRDHGTLATRPLDGLLRGLAGLDSRPYRIVSLHLDARWDDEHQRERARLGLRKALAGAREGLAALPGDIAGPLERDLARADEYAGMVIKQRLDVGFEGIAAFFCEPRRLDLALLSHASLPTRLRVGTRADVLPLARSAQDMDIALVAVVETDETRIFELTMGGTTADVVTGDVPDRVQRGGWRQLRIQKHIAHQIQHHHRDAARDLTARFDAVAALRGRPPRVVLGGRDPMLSSLERSLPERVLAAATRAAHIDPQAAADELLDHVRLALSEALERTDRELLVTVKDEAAAGRGAVGVEPVLAAINAGRAREVLLDPGFDASGSTCTRCDLLTDSVRQECPACGGTAEPVGLADEIARRAVLAAAPVHIIERDGAATADWTGIAALLRY